LALTQPASRWFAKSIVRVQLRLALAIGSAAVALQCGDGSSGGSVDASFPDAPSEGASPLCSPGSSVACAGPGACAGYQVCNDGGNGFGVCNCSLPDAGGPDAPSTEGGDAAQSHAPAEGGDATQPDATTDGGNAAQPDAPAEGGDAAQPDATTDGGNAAQPDGGDAAQNDAATDGGDAGRPEGGSTLAAALRGSVQKGPFVLGSTVTLAGIDATGASTGQVFSTQTTDDLGDFAVNFVYRGYVDMQAQGYYYNELTGGLSSAPIVLRALYNVASGGPQTAHLNMVTHLAHDRALRLMSGGGMTLEAAEAQAESELVAALGIGGSGFTPSLLGVALDELGSNDDANAYLFALSTVLMRAANMAAGSTGSPDAQLTELVNTLAADLASGSPLPAALVARLRTAEHDLDVDLVTDLFAMRLAALGSTAQPASLNRAVDSDGDGYRNSIDTCPLVANPDQTQLPPNVICRASRHTAFLSSSATPTVALLGRFTSAAYPALFADGLAGSGYFLAPGDGTGKFGQPVTATVPAGFAPLRAGDVNADGKLDLLGANGWAPGDGTGNFGALRAFPASFVSTTGAPVLVDLNGDHLPDLVGVTSSGALDIALATSPGTFGAAVVAAMPNAVSPTALALGDVNRDGIVDVVELGSVAWLGDGAGHLNEAVPFTLNGKALADVDGDGNLDVAGTVQSVPFGVAFGDGNGNFGVVGSGPAGAVFGDFNADGRTDAASAGCSASVSVALSVGRSAGSSQALRATPPVGASGCTTPLAISGDINGDEVADLVWIDADSGGVRIQGTVMGGCPGCACAGGAVCGGACCDTSRNVDNCGACGTACAAGQTCQAGSCTCPFAQCGGLCVNEQTAANDCGGCGKVCSPRASCETGACICPRELTACGSACVDLMTNNANCGACSYACATTAPSTAQCGLGRCVVTLATGQNQTALVADDTNVYWAEASTGTVNKVPKAGGTVTTFASGVHPANMAIDGNSLYWNDGGTIVRAPKTGGPVVTIATGAVVYYGPALDLHPVSYPVTSAIALVGSSIYYLRTALKQVTGIDPGEIQDTTYVMSVPADGHASPAVIFSGSYMPSGLQTRDYLAADATSVYWLATDYRDSADLIETRIATGATTRFAPAVASLYPNDFSIAIAMAVDPAHIFLGLHPGSGLTQGLLRVDRSTGAVTTVDIRGPVPAVIVAGGNAYYSHAAVQNGSVQGDISWVPVGSTAYETLVQNINSAQALFADATSLYFATPPLPNDTTSKGTVGSVTPR
jgi:hypothetical protein